jgi:hypothetical protein
MHLIASPPKIKYAGERTEAESKIVAVVPRGVVLTVVKHTGYVVDFGGDEEDRRTVELDGDYKEVRQVPAGT